MNKPNFSKLPDIKIERFYDDTEPMTITLMRSGFLDEPNILVVIDSPFGADIKVMSKSEIELNYGIKIEI